MSQHSSLRIDKVGTRHRNVLKRFERIKKLKNEERWEDKESVYGLPKVKSQKIKTKKTKATGEKPAEGEAPQAAGTGAAKPAAENKKKA